MALDKIDIAGSFLTGWWEADKIDTAARLKVHNENLANKNKAVIEMKKTDWANEITKYEKDKETIKNLDSVKVKLDKGNYNIIQDGKTGINTKQLGYDFLVAKHGIDYVEKQKGILLGAESDPTAWNAYLNNAGNNLNINSDETYKNFKEKAVIDSEYITAIDKINEETTKALNEARGDSKTVKAILGLRDKKITEIKANSNNVETIDTENKIKSTSWINKKDEDKLNEIESTISTEIKTDENNTENLESEKVVFIKPDENIFYPKTFKDEIKKEKGAVKKDLTNINKDVVQTTYEIIKNQTASKDKDFVKFNQDKEATSFTENGIWINDQLKNLQVQIIDSLSPYYIYSTYGTKNANDVNTYISAPDVQNILKTRVEDYTSANSSEFIKKSLLTERETFVGFVPFSIIDLNDNFILNNKVLNVKNLKTTSGESYPTTEIGTLYKNAIKKYVQDNHSTLNKQGIRVFNDNRTEQEWMNKIQNDLIRLKPNSENGLYSSKLADEIKINMGLIKDKVISTTDGSPQIISKDKTIDVVNYNGNEIKLTEKSKKQFEKDGVDWTKLEIINTISTQPEENKIKETKKIIESQTGDASIAEQIEANKVKEKIKPADLGITNQPVFESIEEVQAILPNDMTGAEIKEKYEIAFPLNNKSVYKSKKVKFKSTP